MQYVLASASPRRRELLSQVIEDFIIDPAHGKEEANLSFFPEDMACTLAQNKCDEVFYRHTGSTVIGCDTIVVFQGQVLGKPTSPEDAERTLKMLSGKTHYVITGVALRNRFKKLVRYERTEVKFNVLTDEFIKQYVESGSPLDKAGSYGIQDGGIVERYNGSYTNVVGLPVSLLKNMIKELSEDI